MHARRDAGVLEQPLRRGGEQSVLRHQPPPLGIRAPERIGFVHWRRGPAVAALPHRRCYNDVPDKRNSVTATVRRCRDQDRESILAIIHAAGEAYRGVIPTDRWHEPYMPPTS